MLWVVPTSSTGALPKLEPVNWRAPLPMRMSKADRKTINYPAEFILGGSTGPVPGWPPIP